ncbi:enterochelin esterase [Lentzea xinjiangensis]|uniref:Enterochelin esterase n=1 Tax=Lentzea xinjiangensis TaxID=402600 RepID=A0A1H9LWM6_9PSEU|nr:alpha/beta hydrolase-fold protein [Lentzea xinjiangensis]SER15243.1 enterochelin esterase [Lentzea xinjiangensis]
MTGPIAVPSGDGYRTTFHWRGGPASVRFESVLEPVELRAQDDFWCAEVEMPPRLRVTYHFFDGEEHADPANPEGAGPNRSIFATPDLGPQPHWPVVGPDEVPDVPSLRIRWTGALGRKTVRVHQGGEPVVLLLDGDDWMYAHPAVTAFDSAVKNGEMPAATLVFVPTPRDRDTEYGSSALWQAIRDELLPLLDSNGVAVDPARFVVAGQSLGGLSAFRAALDFPRLVSRVACQSGSFWYAGDLPEHGLSLDGPAGGDIAARLRDQPDLSGLRVAFDAGEHEPRMHRHCEVVEELTAAAGATVRVNRSPAGHDRVGWRHALLRDVAWLLSDL